jgi:hypothetical protein
MLDFNALWVKWPGSFRAPPSHSTPVRAAGRITISAVYRRRGGYSPAGFRSPALPPQVPSMRPAGLAPQARAACSTRGAFPSSGFPRIFRRALVPQCGDLPAAGYVPVPLSRRIADTTKADSGAPGSRLCGAESAATKVAAQFLLPACTCSTVSTSSTTS